MDKGSVGIWSYTWVCFGLEHGICLEVKNKKDFKWFI